MSKSKLPDKPSELIHLALNDLELCEKDDSYAINMHVWHCPELHDDVPPLCAVCMAGSVMAKTLNVPVEVEVCSQSFDWLENQDGEFCTISQKLEAIDEFRQGELYSGLMSMDMDTTAGLQVARMFDPATGYGYVSVPTYKVNPDGFKVRMREIADAFAKVGQ